MEWNGKTILILRTEGDGTKRKQNYKKEERERNNLAEGPPSRMERNDFKKSRNVPSPNCCYWLASENQAEVHLWSAYHSLEFISTSQII